MQFEYKGSISVKEEDLIEMVRLVEEESFKIKDAISRVAAHWDDDVYYLLYKIENDIEKEVEKRIGKNFSKSF